MQEPNGYARLSLGQRIVNSIFGYDYFISYAHSDGSTYAHGLASSLRKHGRQCFLDVDRYRIGDDWKGIGYWRLRGTTCLIVVGSPDALRSTNVAHEVRLFRETRRQVIPIDFDGSLEAGTTPGVPDTELVGLLPPTILRLREGDRLGVGPSDHAVTRIVEDFKGLTQDRKRIRILAAGLCTFAVLAAAAVHFADRSRENEKLSNLSAAEAKAQSKKAEASARDRAREVARNSFALSANASEAQKDPSLALLYAARAVEVLPEPDPMLDVYLSRVIHLVDRLAPFTLSLPTGAGVSNATFAPGMKRVVLSTENSEIQVFSLPDGRPMQVPAFVNEFGAMTPPEFLDRGDVVRLFVHWFHPERDPEERSPYVLEAKWNVVTGAVLAPKNPARVDEDSDRWTVLSQLNEVPKATGAALPSDLVRRIGANRGLAAERARVSSMSPDGRVMFWSTDAGPGLASTATLEAKVRWRQAAFVGLHLLTLRDTGELEAWDVGTRQRTWSWTPPKPERRSLRSDGDEADSFQPSPDGSAVLYGDHVIDVLSGRVQTKLMSLKLQERQENLIERGLLNNSEAVTATHYPWEAGDFFHIRSRTSTEDARKLEPGSVTRSNFEGFLANGRYALTGSRNAFRIVDLSSGTEVCRFSFDSKSNVPPDAAFKLIRKTGVIEDDGKGSVVLRTRDGPALSAARGKEVTTELRLAQSSTIVTAPNANPGGRDGVYAVSADGRSLAAAGAGSLRIWDATTGHPLSEVHGYTGEARDVAFSPDGRKVYLATSTGRLVEVPSLFGRTVKPKWLAGLAEAFTAQAIAKDGSLDRLSPDATVQARNAAASALSADSVKDDAHRMLQQRLRAVDQ